MATKIILKGSVQGVGCRGYCARYARSHGLHGGATNQRDGSVCIIIDTDDKIIINSFMDSVITNPAGYAFFGRIFDYKIELYNGRIDGDYIF
ncbi:MAG TPA: acylphosphatase [Spirochaetota bacterium]|nr:acylphosphatase [Spirochaetota bacterium]HQO39024.1 acylphosphatase [Spirochaetota bacterium]